MSLFSFLDALSGTSSPGIASGVARQAASGAQAAMPFAQTLQQSIDAQQRQSPAPADTASTAPDASGNAAAHASSSRSRQDAAPSDETDANRDAAASSDTSAATGTRPTGESEHSQRTKGASDDDKASAAHDAEAQTASAAEQAAAAAQAAAQAQAEANSAAQQRADGIPVATDTVSGDPALAGVTATGGKALTTAQPKSVRAALEAALSAQMGIQGGVGTGVVANASATGGMTVLGNTGGGNGSIAGNLANGVGAPPLGAKSIMALTGDGKNSNAGPELRAADTAKTMQTGGTALENAAAQTLAAASNAAAGTSADFAALKGAAEAARTALAAAQAAQSAQATTAAANAAGGAAAANTTNMLAPPVGTPDWDDALSQKVVFLSNAHQQSAELTLNPRDLGPLQVVLQVADKHAHALFVSQNPQVREAVEAALPKLREALEAGGLGLGSASVSDGFARQAGQQNGRSGGQGNGQGRGNAQADDGGDALISAAAVATRRKVGIVDTFA